MSRCARLLCSLSSALLTLMAVSAMARGAETADKLIDVKDADAQPMTLSLDDGGSEQDWTLMWADLGVTDGDAPLTGGAGVESFLRANDSSPPAPAVIAAPLPPALLTGLMGLAGVYAYKRRHRLR